MTIVQLETNIYPSSLKFAMDYRGISQTVLCRNVEGVSQPNLSKFLNGYYGCLSNDKLKEIMNYLNFPFEFLYSDVKQVKIL